MESVEAPMSALHATVAPEELILPSGKEGLRKSSCRSSRSYELRLQSQDKCDHVLKGYICGKACFCSFG
jgi:hypothetical protein